MERLYDETYASKDGARTSRNIWYSQLDLTEKGEYGQVVKLDGDLLSAIALTVRNDLQQNQESPSETNWYFYGKGVERESIGKCLLPAVMVREKQGGFLAHVSISDHDFALNIDKVVSFKNALESELQGIGAAQHRAHGG